jgi:hypothetical protein
MSRVTRFGEFLHNGWLFLEGSVFENWRNNPVFLCHFVPLLKPCFNFDKIWVVPRFGRFNLQTHRRPILNFTPRGKLWPHGRSCPRGWNSVCPSILLVNRRECSPLGVNGVVNIPPRGQSSPQGAKFTPRDEVYPRGEVKNGHPVNECRAVSQKTEAPESREFRGLRGTVVKAGSSAENADVQSGSHA